MFPKEQVGSDCPMGYTTEILPGIKLYSISSKTSAIIDCPFRVQGLMEKNEYYCRCNRSHIWVSH